MRATAFRAARCAAAFALLLVLAGLVDLTALPGPTGLGGAAAPLRVVAAQEAAPAHANPFHDPDNPDYATLQDPAAALAGYPTDPTGLSDWMKMLDQGLIQPRADLKGSGRMEVLDLDIVMKNTKEMPWVRFPHRSHTLWLACSNCHDGIFVARAGANAIDMNKIFRGQFCGVCHDRVAFQTMFACHRCHSVPHGSMQPWWTSQ